MSHPYDATQNKKKHDEPHNPVFPLNPLTYSSFNVLSDNPRTSLFSVPTHITFFPVEALINTGAFSKALSLHTFYQLKRVCPNFILNITQP